MGYSSLYISWLLLFCVAALLVICVFKSNSLCIKLESGRKVLGLETLCWDPGETNIGSGLLFDHVFTQHLAPWSLVCDWDSYLYHCGSEILTTLGSVSSSATACLCDHGQVTSPLGTSVCKLEMLQLPFSILSPKLFSEAGIFLYCVCGI